MPIQKIARINAILFFLFWLFILLAGADFPPPRAFLWIVLVVALCAVIVFLRIPTYIDWYRKKRPGHQWCVLIEGFVAGIVIASIFAIEGSGEPTVSVEPAGYAIWFAVLGVIGVLNSTALYLVNVVVSKKLDFKR